jgi:hypothetical protein
MKKTPIILTLTTLLLCSGASATIAAPVTNEEYQTAFVGRLLKEPVRCLAKPACRKVVSNRMQKLKVEIIDYLWEWPELELEPERNQSDDDLKAKLQELERTLRESGRHNPEVQHKLDDLYDLLSNKPHHLS